MREKAVCLDELAIAITSKHGMIRTILLESSDSFTPPSFVTEYQWGDMSIYPEIKKKGIDVFEKYIDAEAQLIIDMLLSDEIKKYNKEIEIVRTILHMSPIESLNRFDLLLSNEMIGREWLEKEVCQWIENVDSKQIMMLYGKPGSGKSMFAAYLQHYNPNIVAACPCNCNSEKYSSTTNIIFQIAYKLALRLPDYRTWMLENVKDEFFKIESSHDLFVNLVANPLSYCIDGKRAPMVIIIDALDEAENDEFAKFVVEYIPLMKKWIKFLITARKESRIINHFRAYQEIDIDKNEQNNRNDLKIYYHTRLRERFSTWEGYDAFLERLVDSSEGVFTYAKCICENIMEDAEEFCFEMLSEYKIPRGLYALFLDTLDRKFNSARSMWNRRDYIEFWQKPLGMIIAASEPMEVKTLMKLMKWNRNDYSKFISAISILVIEQNDRLFPFHNSFVEWLDAEQSDYFTSREIGEENIVEACRDIYHEDSSCLDNYMLLYYPKLLFKIEGFKKEKTELLKDISYWNRVINTAEEYLKSSYYLKAEAYCKCYININNEFMNRKLDDKNLLDEHESMYGWVLFVMGRIFQDKNMFQEALKYLFESLKVQESLRKQYSNCSFYWRNMPLLMDTIGDIYISLGKYEKAIQYYISSMRTLENLSDMFFDETSFKRNQCVSWIKLGELAEKNRDLEQAIEYYKKAEIIYRGLLKNNQRSSKLKEDLCNTLLHIEYLYVSKGMIFTRINDIHLYCEEALRLARDLYNMDNTNAEYVRLLCIALNEVGRFKESEGKMYFEESRKLTEELCKNFPENISYIILKMHTKLHLADFIQLIEKNFDDALVMYKEEIETLEGLCEKYPENLNYKRDYTILLVKVANATDDMQEVEKYYKKAIMIRQRLVQEYPQDKTFVRDLWNVLMEMGEFCTWIKKDLREREYYFKRARELMKDL